MTTGLTELLAFLSDSAAVQVAAAARRVAAIRIGTRKHLCATLWSPDFAVTCAWSLPEQDRFLLLLDSGHAVGHLAWRDEDSGLAGIQLDTAHPLPAIPAPRPIAPDTALISVGIDDAGAPVAGLAVLLDAPAGKGNGTARIFPGIDRDAGSGDLGGPLIAPSGALVGIIARHDGQGGPAHVVPHAVVTRLIASAQAPCEAPVHAHVHELAADALFPVPRADAFGHQAMNGDTDVMTLPATRPMNGALYRKPPSGRRGWLGVGLQPTSVPRALRPLAGQNSGRMVIDIVPDGPADRAGLLPGDVVLTIAEHSMVGAGAVRDFLSQDRVGETAEIVLLRSGELFSLNITVSERPPG